MPSDETTFEMMGYKIIPTYQYLFCNILCSLSLALGWSLLTMKYLVSKFVSLKIILTAHRTIGSISAQISSSQYSSACNDWWHILSVGLPVSFDWKQDALIWPFRVALLQLRKVSDSQMVIASFSCSASVMKYLQSVEEPWPTS